VAEEITVLKNMTIEEQAATLHAWADSSKEAVVEINNKMYPVAIEVVKLIEALVEENTYWRSRKK